MTVDEMSAEEHMLVICEDPFFRLSYIVDFDYKYQTSLSHRCHTANHNTYTWNWRWSIFNECQHCGIDIPYDLMRTWRMFLMLDEVELDSDFVRKVYYPFTKDEQKVYWWRQFRKVKFI